MNRNLQKSVAILIALIISVLYIGNACADSIIQKIGKSISEATTEIEVSEDNETGPTEKKPATDNTPDGYVNILIIGSDERRGGFNENARGDSCILFSVNTENGNVHLVSFERATGVEVLDGVYQGQWDWLTHTFRYGGAKLMVREVSEHFDVRIDGYVRINLRTFVELIDAIGGVDIELTGSEARYVNGSGKGTARDIGTQGDVQHVSEGLNHLNGATALVYARCRHIDSDWKRVERQRKVIIAALQQMVRLDPPSMIRMAGTLLTMVDTDISIGTIGKFLPVAAKLSEGSIKQKTFPEKGTYHNKRGMGGRSMYIPNDWEENNAALHAFLYGNN